MGVVRVSDDIRAERLTRLVHAHQDTLMNLCYMYLRDRELAKDAVQETFLKAYRAIDTLEGEDGARAWLTKIALNTCRDVRRSAWHRHLNRSVTPEDIPCVAGEDVHSDALELADAIMRLPDKYKEVILLYYFQDMPLKDIAPMVGITKSMVSRRISKACALLHGLLGEE